MILSRWKIMTCILGLSVGGLTVCVGQSHNKLSAPDPKNASSGSSAVASNPDKKETPAIAPDTLPPVPAPLPSATKEFELELPMPVQPQTSLELPPGLAKDTPEPAKAKTTLEIAPAKPSAGVIPAGHQPKEHGSKTNYAPPPGEVGKPNGVISEPPPANSEKKDQREKRKEQPTPLPTTPTTPPVVTPDDVLIAPPEPQVTPPVPTPKPAPEKARSTPDEAIPKFGETPSTPPPRGLDLGQPASPVPMPPVPQPPAKEPSTILTPPPAPPSSPAAVSKEKHPIGQADFLRTSPVPAKPEQSQTQKLKMLLRMGVGTPRFEIRNATGEDLLLKVVAEKIEMKSAPEGVKASPLAGVTASGKVKFTGPGIEGTCEELSILSGTGEVMLKGSVHMKTKLKAKSWSELTADKMIYQIGSSGLTAATTTDRSTFTPVQYHENH